MPLAPLNATTPLFRCFVLSLLVSCQALFISTTPAVLPPLHVPAAECDGILLGIEFAGSDLSPPQSGLPTITACYTACKAIKNCAAFTYTAAGGGCAFRGISNWVLQSSPGSQSVVMCVDPFPATDYSPPLPPPR
jgi:hypothetical protein